VPCEIHQALEWNKGHDYTRFSSIVTGEKGTERYHDNQERSRKDMSGCDSDTLDCQSMKETNQKVVLRNTLYCFYDPVLQSTSIAY
jgi:hypothetical protein